MKPDGEKIKFALLIVFAWVFALGMLFIVMVKLRIFSHIHL